jgi:hypothetical protein
MSFSAPNVALREAADATDYISNFDNGQIKIK